MLLMMMVLTDEQSELAEKLHKEYYALFYSIAYKILRSEPAMVIQNMPFLRSNKKTSTKPDIEELTFFAFSHTIFLDCCIY